MDPMGMKPYEMLKSLHVNTLLLFGSVSAVH